jgi:hypothetical protein
MTFISTNVADHTAGVDYTTGISAKPATVTKVAVSAAPKDVIKVATSNLFNLGEPPINPDTLTDLLFQEMGGQDIINVLRTDTVNGSSFKNNVITNLSTINEKFNSLNLITMSGESSGYFKSMHYELLDHIPEGKTLIAGVDPLPVTVVSNVPTNYYVDPVTGDITFYFSGLSDDQQVQFEFIEMKRNPKSTGGYPLI